MTALVLSKKNDDLHSIIYSLTVCDYLQSREEDENGDGKYDALHLTLQMPLLDTEHIQAVKLLLTFDYKMSVSTSARTINRKLELLLVLLSPPNARAAITARRVWQKCK